MPSNKSRGNIHNIAMDIAFFITTGDLRSSSVDYSLLVSIYNKTPCCPIKKKCNEKIKFGVPRNF